LRWTGAMQTGEAGETGSPVTAEGDKEQVRGVLLTMPANKRLVVQRREMTSQQTDMSALSDDDERTWSIYDKEQVLGRIADILDSGETSQQKERKLANIISDLETVRRRLTEQTTSQLKVAYAL